MYLFDTNSLSEFIRKKPDPNFQQFIQKVRRSRQSVFISVITTGEIIKGIKTLERRNDFIQAKRYQDWFENEITHYIQNALICDDAVVRIWGQLLAINPHNEVDKLIAATAMVHDLILVTRNTKHIADTGVRFINPFE